MMILLFVHETNMPSSCPKCTTDFCYNCNHIWESDECTCDDTDEPVQLIRTGEVPDNRPRVVGGGRILCEHDNPWHRQSFLPRVCAFCRARPNRFILCCDECGVTACASCRTLTNAERSSIIQRRTMATALAEDLMFQRFIGRM